MEIVVFYAQIVSIPLETVSFGYRSKHKHSSLVKFVQLKKVYCHMFPRFEDSGVMFWYYAFTHKRS